MQLTTRPSPSRGTVARRLAGSIVMALAVGWPVAASAHPHILASVGLEITFDGKGSVQRLKSAWTYDAFYAAFAKRQIDTDHDGVLSPDELRIFADGQIAALREFKYFTSLRIDGQEVSLDDATDGHLETAPDGGLTLTFTQSVPSARPGHSLDVEIFDPHFFAYFTVPQNGSAVHLTDAPASCTTSVTGPSPIDLKRPASVPQLFWAALDGSSEAGKQFVNRVSVSCP